MFLLINGLFVVFLEGLWLVGEIFKKHVVKEFKRICSKINWLEETGTIVSLVLGIYNKRVTTLIAFSQ